jgi:hypothetical protein
MLAVVVEIDRIYSRDGSVRDNPGIEDSGTMPGKILLNTRA